MDDVVKKLLDSDEPSIRYGARLALLGEDPHSLEMCALQEQIRSSARVKTLLSRREEQGQIPGHPYNKWTGAHWILANLAELYYPLGDKALLPMRDQQFGFFFTKDMRPARKKIVVNGQPRMCASIEANGLFSTLALGIADERAARIFDLLLDWRWPDGGWNCDKHPGASRSSFMETLIPLRAVNLYYRYSGDPRAVAIIEQASEVFLRRKLFRRISDGQVMDAHFIRLHFPLYWHYDILGGLTVIAEIGRISDPRCAEALDLIESNWLSNGGFAAEETYYSTSPNARTGRSLVDWGGTSRRNMNPWVTLEALKVLKAAGRFSNR